MIEREYPFRSKPGSGTFWERRSSGVWDLWCDGHYESGWLVWAGKVVRRRRGWVSDRPGWVAGRWFLWPGWVLRCLLRVRHLVVEHRSGAGLGADLVGDCTGGCLCSSCELDPNWPGCSRCGRWLLEHARVTPEWCPRWQSFFDRVYELMMNKARDEGLDWLFVDDGGVTWDRLRLWAYETASESEGV